MESERKQKLLRYLYPNENVREFMFEDLYVELSAVVPRHICISPKNFKASTRKENLQTARSVIQKFLNDNIDYSKKVMVLLSKNEIDNETVDEILMGFVLYVSGSRQSYIGMDIFRDKKSVCYSPVAVIDII